jgi:hypothetical protein
MITMMSGKRQEKAEGRHLQVGQQNTVHHMATREIKA